MLHNKSMKAASEKADEIIELVGFSGIVNMLCSKLPIEKRKWLDMARVLAINPKLLMLDECLAGLTPIEMEESIALVQKINQAGITVLFIEHVMSAVTKLCHRVVVLNEGKLLSQGEPSVVMREESVIKAYLGEDYVNVTN
jgi:ABC-type branched-subunit amino acid transport system ATPase component